MFINSILQTVVLNKIRYDLLVILLSTKNWMLDIDRFEVHIKYMGVNEMHRCYLQIR